jgi:hypothetical protein
LLWVWVKPELVGAFSFHVSHIICFYVKYQPIFSLKEDALSSPALNSRVSSA